MDDKLKIVLDFIKKMHLERQKSLLHLKTIKLGKRELDEEEEICRKKIKIIENKIRSEVLANAELKKQFGVSEDNESEETDREEY